MGCRPSSWSPVYLARWRALPPSSSATLRVAAVCRRVVAAGQIKLQTVKWEAADFASAGDSKMPMGRAAEARKILAEVQKQSSVVYISPYMVAAIYSGLGDKDKACLFLEKAYEERSPDLAYFSKADLRMDALRQDSRFQSILQRVALP